MEEQTLAEYKTYVKEQLARLQPIFANASIGDYSKDVEIPEGDDEFTQLAMGVQIMLEVIRDRIKELEEELNERKIIEERVRHQALHDPLTGLPNRKALEERLEITLAQARRGGRMVALLYLDIDHFKEINDEYGHHIGDLVLQEFSRLIFACIREEDTMARLGGDEFIIVLAETKSVEDVARVAHKIMDAIRHDIKLEGHTLTVATSIGIALYPNDSSDIWSLVSKADKALMIAKQSGRNQFQFYNAKV